MPPVHIFGPFRYDSGQRLLFRNGEMVALVPKAIDTLHALLERRGAVVEKAELMKLVWPDTTVEEIGLARNISLLRKALGDDSETYIETVPKRGYRFVAAAEAESAPAVPATPKTRWSWRWAALGAATLAVSAWFVYWQFYRPSGYLPGGGMLPSMAVMPFEAVGQGDRAVSRGWNELLVAEVSKLPAIQVVSPSTIRRYRAARIPTPIAARVLGLAVILEGTIQKTPDRTRITARLADVHSGKLIWADSYDTPGEPGKDLAQAVAAQVGAHLAIHDRFPR